MTRQQALEPSVSGVQCQNCNYLGIKTRYFDYQSMTCLPADISKFTQVTALFQNFIKVYRYDIDKKLFTVNTVIKSNDVLYSEQIQYQQSEITI